MIVTRSIPVCINLKWQMYWIHNNAILLHSNDLHSHRDKFSPDETKIVHANYNNALLLDRHCTQLGTPYLDWGANFDHRVTLRNVLASRIFVWRIDHKHHGWSDNDSCGAKQAHDIKHTKSKHTGVIYTIPIFPHGLIALAGGLTKTCHKVWYCEKKYNRCVRSWASFPSRQPQYSPQRENLIRGAKQSERSTAYRHRTIRCPMVTRKATVRDAVKRLSVGTGHCSWGSPACNSRQDSAEGASSGQHPVEAAQILRPMSPTAGEQGE